MSRPDAKSTFQSISTIHVYSLEPTTLPDLNVLVDVNREIASTHGQEDPLECGKQWGMIQNRDVRVGHSSLRKVYHELMSIYVLAEDWRAPTTTTCSPRCESIGWQGIESFD